MNTKNILQKNRINESFISWIRYVVIIWSLLYGSMHLYWLLGGQGYPFLYDASMGLFAGKVTYLSPKVGSTIFVVFCFIGVIIGFFARKWTENVFLQRLVLFYAWGLAFALLFFTPDFTLIAAIAYAFLLKFQFSWAMFNQIICVFGAVAWGFFAVAYKRKIDHACEHCGRKAKENTFFLARWGRVITYIAAFAPIPYAITRYAWALGIPLGMDAKSLEEFSTINPDHHIAEWIFGSLCVIGGILTLGLIQRWGETFPRWIPLLRGKRVPILLAVIPAFCVAIAVTAAGISFTFPIIMVQFYPSFSSNFILGQSQIWGAVGPMLLWIPWGLALGLASIAYYYRRRGPCNYCGRGETENIR